MSPLPRRRICVWGSVFMSPGMDLPFPCFEPASKRWVHVDTAHSVCCQGRHGSKKERVGRNQWSANIHH